MSKIIFAFQVCNLVGEIIINNYYKLESTVIEKNQHILRASESDFHSFLF